MHPRGRALLGQLKKIDPATVFGLQAEYIRRFPEHPQSEELFDPAATPLSNLEGYFFDPDRLTHMCRATQDAVRRVSEQTTGRIEVVDSGLGLGYVGLSALALNDELDGRVHFTGIELNPATRDQAGIIYDANGIPKDWYNFVVGDSRTISSLPPNTRVLVAEHLAMGLFTPEPMYPIHANLVPKLTPPFYIIPEGVDVYGRVTRSDLVRSMQEFRDRLRGTPWMEEPLDRNGILRLPESGAQKRLPQPGKSVISRRRIGQVHFGNVLNGGWNGHVEMALQGPARYSAEGTLELKSVPRFHSDDEDHPALQETCFYRTGVFPNNVAFGTSLNHWTSIREGARTRRYLASHESTVDVLRMGPIGFSLHVMNSDRFAAKHRFEAGKTYRVVIDGDVYTQTLAADVAFSEL